MLNRYFCFFMLVLAVVPAGASDSDKAERKAEELFKNAFRDELEIHERVECVREVVRKYGDTKWGDDALWVLARVADKRDNLSEAVVLRHQLLERESGVELEPFTRAQKLYETSRASQLDLLLTNDGHIYSGKGGHPERYDVMRLALHDRLGRCYEQLGLGRSSIREYKEALRLAPGEHLRERYENRLADLRRKYPERESAKENTRGEAKRNASAENTRN